MSSNARSLADLDRRIRRLESRGDAGSADQANALREARVYMAQARLLPEALQTKRQRQPQNAEGALERDDQEQRSQKAQAHRVRQRDRREAR